MPKSRSQITIRKNYYPLYRNYFKRKRRFGTEYFQLKADYNFVLWKTNNQSGSTGVGFTFHNPEQLNSDVSELYLYSLFASGFGDYANFKLLFNQFRIRGLRVVSIPNPGNGTNSITYKDNPIFFAVNFVHPITENEAINSNNMMFMNAFEKQVKYFKNLDSEWFTTDINTQVASNPSSLRGMLLVGPAANNVLQNASPSWTLRLTFYIVFRKTKAN